MIKRFTKGQLRKELVYIRAKVGEYRNQPHVVSQYPSDAQGRMQLMRERSEEFPHEKQAIECFGKWEQELMADGWQAEWRNAGKPPEAKKAMTDEQIRKMISLAVKSKETPKAKPKLAPNPKKKKKKTTFAERECMICGKRFIPCVANQKCCSGECSHERHTLNDRRSYERLRQAKKAKKDETLKDETPVKEMEKKEMKTGNVLSWYESARYVITEFMNKAETEEDVKFISDALSGCLDNALKDAAVRMVIKKRYPMVQEAADDEAVIQLEKKAGE